MAKNNQPKNQRNRWLALSGIGLQMGVTIFICAWGGKKLDAYFETSKNWFTIGLVIFGVVASLYALMHQLKYLNKDND